MGELLAALIDYKMSVGEFLQYTVRSAVAVTINFKFEDLGVSMRSLIASCLVFSLMVYGVRTMVGSIQDTGKEVVTTCFYVLVGLSITAPAFYTSFVTESVYLFKDNLTSFIMLGDSDTNIYQAFSETNGRMFAHADNVMDKAGMTDISMWVHALTIMIIYGLYYLVFVAVTLYCELALGVLLLLGAIIIPLSAFASCRELGKSWLKAIAKYAAVFIIVAFIVSLLNLIGDALITEYMAATYSPRSGSLDESAVNMNNPVFGGILLIGGFGFYLMLQAMEFATELTGGVMSDGAAGVKSAQNTANFSLKSVSSVGTASLSALKLAKKAKG